ncbi:hypothetical protein [Phenylobacterium sp.]|uniref:hypothetical protein n=1 Tax=Phenylobacterium sp. TaxID=1871053 RepID=UPI002EDA43FD
MRFVMRGYGRGPGVSTPRNVIQIALRATTPEDAVAEADRHWRRNASMRACRGYSVFDAQGRPLTYVRACEPA